MILASHGSASRSRADPRDRRMILPGTAGGSPAMKRK